MWAARRSAGSCRQERTNCRTGLICLKSAGKIQARIGQKRCVPRSATRSICRARDTSFAVSGTEKGVLSETFLPVGARLQSRDVASLIFLQIFFGFFRDFFLRCAATPFRVMLLRGLGGHYEPPARSWLTIREDTGRKRGPTSEGERRRWSAGRRASLADICADCVNLSAAQGMRHRRSQAGADCASLSARGSWCAFRRSAPLILARGKWIEGGPGAFQTIRVAKLWLFDN